MPADPFVLAVVVASVRPGRFAPVVAAWFLQAVRDHGAFALETVDLIDYDLPVDLSPSPAAEDLAAVIARADAVVVVTPEYNHGYPASLKTALDTLKYEWRGKPIGFVSYGGVSGGARAVEQLRQVAAELHMVSVRDSVAFPRARKAFDTSGTTTDGVAVDAAGRMLDQMLWWAEAARNQNVRTPYPGQ